MAADTFTTSVQALQITIATSLIFIGGLSSCLSLWIMPLTARLAPRPACAQFTQTVTWGFRYLQPSSQLLAISLLATTLLTSQLPDPAHAHAWKTWAAALAALVPVAPYEVYAIFPLNARVRQIGEDLEGEKEREGKDVEEELKGLFGSWKVWNWGRVVMPVAAGMIGWWGVVR
ncbi:uncharacterized protein M421DRAFT_343619 [Didymella exigua CBS 183.55]|uniref:DUF1772-domain-containing protein n=1 Tax=Didymella exigua CBS 183.55 TaxID=1150837 RepID=A0A6A5RS74_9PLEO|nr:uncharacterized protein M421DRAFT_343619 [Didymella exigua CBS 183.55]KAF1931301.1 hypothetical protein M421DRAFT_343619 [Didymella exigua CBS 183.55]